MDVQVPYTSLMSNSDYLASLEVAMQHQEAAAPTAIQSQQEEQQKSFMYVSK